MITVNPTNEQTGAMLLLAEMVAGAASFQEQAGVHSNDELLEKFIHYPYYWLPNQQVDKPYAVIYEQRFGYRRIADGTQIPNGVLVLQLGINQQNADEAEGEAVFFNNWQGDIAAHVRAQSQIAGNLHCLLEQSVPPTRSHPAHIAALGAQLPFWFVEYTVTWDPIA